MVIYRKVFPLREGISFSTYIKVLAKKQFPKYYLRIEKTSFPTNYRGTLVSTVPNWEWGLRGPFMDGVLLKECTIQYSEGQKYFTIQASARTANLFLVSIIVIYAVLLFIFELFMMISNNGISLTDTSILTAVTIFVLIPPIWIYLQDKNFLDIVGSLGTELEKN